MNVGSHIHLFLDFQTILQAGSATGKPARRALAFYLAGLPALFAPRLSASIPLGKNVCSNSRNWLYSLDSRSLQAKVEVSCDTLSWMERNQSPGDRSG
jgi:hypothetical protein